jgi:hypothetical protein
MSVVKKEYMTIFDTFKQPLEQYVLPDWFVHAAPKYTKIVRVLGCTASYIKDNMPYDLSKNMRIYSNLTSDFPSNQNFTPSILNPTFNFVMMVNNYNSAKEFDVTHSNLQYLQFEYLLQNGGVFGEEFYDVVIELELMICT